MSPGRPRKLNDLAVQRFRLQKTPIAVIAMAFGVTEDAVKKSIRRQRRPGPTVGDLKRVLRGLAAAVRDSTDTSAWLEEAQWCLGS